MSSRSARAACALALWNLSRRHGSKQQRKRASMDCQTSRPGGRVRYWAPALVVPHTKVLEQALQAPELKSAWKSPVRDMQPTGLQTAKSSLLKSTAKSSRRWVPRMRTTQAALLSRFFLCEAIMQLASAEIYLAMDCFAMCPMKLNSHPATPEQRVTTTRAEKHVFDCSLSRHWHWHGWRSRRAKWLLMPPCGLRKACLDSCASPRKVCTEKKRAGCLGRIAMRKRCRLRSKPCAWPRQKPGKVLQSGRTDCLSCQIRLVSKNIRFSSRRCAAVQRNSCVVLVKVCF